MDRAEKEAVKAKTYPKGVFYDQLKNRLTINMPVYDGPDAPPTTPASITSSNEFDDFYGSSHHRRNRKRPRHGRRLQASDDGFTIDELHRTLDAKQESDAMMKKEEQQYYSSVDFPMPSMINKNTQRHLNIKMNDKNNMLSQQSKANDTRIVKQGRYHIEIEQTMFKKEDSSKTNNLEATPNIFMTTPPFTFSYMSSKKSSKLKKDYVTDIKKSLAPHNITTEVNTIAVQTSPERSPKDYGNNAKRIKKTASKKIAS